MKRRFLLLLPLVPLLSAIVPAAAQTVTVARGWNDFYARADYGQLAIITTPSAAAPTFDIVGPGVATPVGKGSGKEWFVLNHLDRTATSHDMVATYVGVLVVVARRSDQAVGKPLFAIHRNPGWTRSYCRREDCFDGDGTDASFTSQQQLSGCGDSVLSCVGSDRSQTVEAQFDDLVETPFDGQVAAAQDVDSWNRRDSWNQPAISDRLGCGKNGIVCEYENILLAFVPSAGRPNMSPVKHYFDASLAVAAAIYTFSPTETDFDNVYYIDFAK